jgi:hypothetical protein
MFYLGLMLGEKAKLETDGNARTADVNEAETWLKKGLELRKKAQPAAPKPATQVALPSQVATGADVAPAAPHA